MRPAPPIRLFIAANMGRNTCVRHFQDSDLAGLLAGERHAWERFVPHAAAIMRGVIRRTLLKSGRSEDTADCLQEAFLKLCRNDFALLRRYDPARATLSTWLGVIAASVALDSLRRVPPPPMPLDEAPEPAAHSSSEPGNDRLDLPRNLLPPRQALILKMIYEDGHDVAEVSRLLGIEAQTVRSLRHKALTRLREYLRRG